MNRQKWRPTAGTVCFLALATIFAGGCATTAADNKAETTPRKISVLAEEQLLGNKMLKAFQDNDASTFISLLHKDTRTRFDKKEFTENRENVMKVLGNIDSYQYLTSLEMPTLHPLIWKVRFCRKAKQKNEPPVYQETLFRIIFGRLDGKLYVLSFGFL